MYLRKCLYVILTGILLTACVDTFDPGLTSDTKKLVVEGEITDKYDYINIQLSLSAGYNNKESIYDSFVNFADVTIKDDLGQVIKFTEDNAKTGLYTSVSPVRAQVGRTYTLQIVYLGRTYRSKPEKMVSVPDIKAVKSVFEVSTDAKPQAIGNFNLYVDVDDPANATNYYKWSFNHYKQINICKLKRPLNTGEAQVPFNQYPCCEPCWQIKKCEGCLNIASDNLVNGKVLSNQYIGQVPYSSTAPYFILIEQKSLSKEAFIFWRTVKEQTSNSGGIFDVPPTAIKGNISNINDPTEQVLGYFAASSVKLKPLYVRRFVPGLEPFASVVVLKLGPIINDECNECKEGPLRTQLRPFGWDDAYGISEYWID